ncbi:MAG: TonB-dependent receptor [Hyphomonadaceae bacterium]|nr:TonB-dependent receptor [Hyphomonadaceae bacterium]
MNVENVQTVPISVTAFNEDTLDALKVRDLQGLTYSAPNVSLDDIGTSRGSANFSIRGLGVNSSIPSIDPTVGVFVDGVYLGLNTGVVLDLFDLDSIELLRGPQGLLFGRNTTGGAVLVNTGNPTDEFSYKARVSTESPIESGRGGLNSTVQGTVSGPIIEGVLNGKIGAYYNFDDGYFKNLEDGENHGEAQTQIYRAGLEWFATDRLTLLAKGEYFTSRGDGPSGQNRGIYERDSFDFAIDQDGELDNETIFGTLRADLDVDFGDGTITNILGYRELDSTTIGDIDATNLFLFHSNTELTQEQISNELRYAGTFGKVGITTGLYYFNQDVAYTEVRDLPPLSPLTFYGGGGQDHTVYGVFAQMDYAFTENFTGIFGLRYSSEEKDASITYIRPRMPCSVVDGTCPTSGTNSFIPTENNGFTDSNDWSNVTPKIGFQYFPNENTNLYGNYTRGFRSGGYNFRITAPAAFEAIFPPGAERSFDEETVDSFEIGAKYDSPSGLRLNAAAFLTQISDMQRELNLSDPEAGVLQTIINTADADIMGIELEGSYAVSDTLLLTANIGAIDAEYTSVDFDISSDGLVDGADEALSLPRVPELTYGFGLIHDLDLGSSGVITSRLNFQHRDEFAYTDNNFGWIQEADMLDVNFAWQTPYDGLSVSLYGKNLLDEVQAGGDTQVPFGGPQAGLAPGGQNLANGVNTPFDVYPATGTFSPLKKGSLIGIEVTIQR